MRSAFSALLLTLCATLAPAATLQYKPATTIATGFQSLNGLAVADFNGDGKLDLAVTDTYGKQIVVYLNKGDGTFSSPLVTTLNIPDTTGALVVGDFNEDGHPDLIVATIAAPEQDDLLLLGKGDGTFTPGPVLPGSAGFQNAAVVDINHDAHLDLIAAGNGTLYIHLGDGHGNFTLQPFSDQGTSGLFFDVAAADFNKDGNVDFVTALAYSSIPNGLRVFTGAGNGSFSSPLDLSGNPFTTPEFLRSADFNGDGKPDLLVGEPDVAFVLLGKGDATFNLSAPAYFALPQGSGDLGQNAPPVATADLDGNGTADVVVADNLSNTINAFLNDGTGTFGQGTPDFSISTAFGSGHVELADLNGDGLPDIIVTNYKTGLITIILSTRARATPTVTLSGTASQVAGAPLNFTVAVAGTQGLATGSVTLLDNTTSLATQPLNTSGDASFSISSLAAGPHTLTASYAGDTIYLPLSSAAFQASVSDFQLALSTATQTVTAGNAATFTIAISPIAGFTGSVSATCSGLPAGFTCTAAPVTLNSQGASLAVVVSPAKSASSQRPGARSGAFICLVLVILLPFHRKQVPALLSACIALGMLEALSGCSSSSSSSKSNPQSTAFTITVTAAQSMETVSHQVTATLVVQ